MAAQYPHWLSLSSHVLSWFVGKIRSQLTQSLRWNWLFDVRENISNENQWFKTSSPFFPGFSLFDASILKLKTFLLEKRKKTKTIQKISAEHLAHVKQRRNSVFKFYNRKLRTNKTLEKFIISSQLEAPPEPFRGCLTQVTLGISPPQSWRNSARHTAVQRIKRRAPWRTLLSGYWPDKACVKES